MKRLAAVPLVLSVLAIPVSADNSFVVPNRIAAWRPPHASAPDYSPAFCQTGDGGAELAD
jgi:hypothetical protein